MEARHGLRDYVCPRLSPVLQMERVSEVQLLMLRRHVFASSVLRQAQMQRYSGGTTWYIGYRHVTWRFAGSYPVFAFTLRLCRPLQGVENMRDRAEVLLRAFKEAVMLAETLVEYWRRGC